MKKNILSKLFCLLLALSMVLCLGVAANAEETATSGTCGASVTWSYADGVLTLTGTGATVDYQMINSSTTDDYPWAAYADQITTVVVGEGVTTLENYLFYGLSNLTSVTLPSTLQRTETRVFKNCSSLTSITIPSSLTFLGLENFVGTAITDIYFLADAPVNVSGTKPCNGLVYNVHTPCGNTSWTATALAKLGGTQTQVIEHTYENGACTVCGTVQTISGTFSTGVSWVYANGTLTISGTGATDKFTGMSESHPFYSFKDAVTTIIVEEGVEKLDQYLFYKMTGVTQVQLPSTLTNIENRAFSYCESLTEITMPASIKYLGPNIFVGSGITSLYFEGTTPPSISSAASPFNDGAKAYTVYAPCGGSWTADTIANWGGSSKKLSLQHTVENNVCTVCGMQYCGTNITWTFADGVLTLSGTGEMYAYSAKGESPFYSIKDQVTSIVVNEGITKLGVYSFYEMSQLTEVQLPSTLTHINSRNFGYCTALEQITIPQSVTFLGSGAFINSGIQDVIFEGATPPGISTEGGVFGGCTYNVHVPCNGSWTGDVLDKLGGTPTLVPGHSFVDNTCTICGAKQVFALVQNGEQVAVYGTLIEAISARVSGQLIRLVDDAQVEVTLPEDLFIDLAGYDLSGTITCGDYKVYGIDSATDEFTTENRGIFSCVDENGTAIVPVSHFQTKLAGNNRYLAISEETGYSFHRITVDITHISLKPSVTGVGYKAAYAGNDMVNALVASCGYSLQLGDGPVISRSKGGVSAALTLRINNFDAASFGKTELYAVATMTLTDGTVIESTKQSITLYDLMQSINETADTYSAEQLAAIRTMIDGNETMQSWNLHNLWDDAAAAQTLKAQLPADATNDELTAFFESYDAQGYVHLTKSGAPYVISSEGTPVMIADVAPDYVSKMTDADYAQMIALGESYMNNMSSLVYGNTKTAFNETTTNELDCSSFLQLVLAGVSYENSKYAGGTNACVEGFGITFPDNPYRDTWGAERYLANDLAQYAYDQGYAFTPNADATNMQPGDILFFSTKETDGYFMDITHAAICIEGPEGNIVRVFHCSSDGDLVRYYDIDLVSEYIYSIVANPYKDSLVLIARFPV